MTKKERWEVERLISNVLSISEKRIDDKRGIKSLKVRVKYVNIDGAITPKIKYNLKTYSKV